MLAGLVLGLAVHLPALSAPERDPEHADVRVLIDISGSMRQNDPNNLRQSALRLLVGLMQPGTRAGVWTFAGGAEELLARGEVDPAWKSRGMRLSTRIGSPGQRTDIEGVLQEAVTDWRGRTPAFRRHILLLTDGMVDVAKDDRLSAVSRQRILDELLPELRTLSVRVHAIALSERADHDLLQRLSAATDGWYQQVDAAAELQRAFLRIFEKAGKPDAVPLNGNRFEIDRSVEEATVLVFRQPDADPTRLHSPDGEVFTGSDLVAGVAWQHDEGYDLITISEPGVGEWTLEADVDPDNRVMVVTDLRLKTAELPSRIAVGEAVPVIAHLTNRGRLINKRAFLDLLTVRASSRVDGHAAELALNDRGEAGDQDAGDGYFSARLRHGRAAGELELLVAAESETFVRQQRHRFAVVEPMSVALSAEQDGGQPGVRVAVDETVVQPGADLSVWQEPDPDRVVELELLPGAEGGLAAQLNDPAVAVFARLVGTGRGGQPIERTIGPLYPPGHRPETGVAVPPGPVAEPEPASGEADGGPIDEPDAGLALAPLLFLAANALLLAAGALFWWLRRRGGEDRIVLVEESDAALDEAFDIAGDEAQVAAEGKAA